LFQKRIYSIFLRTLVGKRMQTISKKRWFDITSPESVLLDKKDMISFDGADSGTKTQPFWFHSC
jgi:hypothetical protein